MRRKARQASLCIVVVVASQNRRVDGAAGAVDLARIRGRSRRNRRGGVKRRIGGGR